MTPKTPATPPKLCYLAVALRDGAIVDAWLHGPSAPWVTSRRGRVGVIIAAVDCWSGGTYGEAHRAAVQTLAAMADVELDPFAAVRPHLRGYVQTAIEAAREALR